MRMLMTTAAVVASLAFAGTSAMAGSPSHYQYFRPHAAHSRVSTHVAPGRHYARGRYNFDVGQFAQSMFGVHLNLPRFAARTRGGSSSEWSGYTPSYDSPAVDNSSAANDAAMAASQQANENMMLQSMQAAQQQNDEANAAVTAGILAAQQTEINAGM